MQLKIFLGGYCYLQWFFYIYQVMFSVKVMNISKSYRRSSIMMGHTIHFWSYTQVIAIPIFHSSIKAQVSFSDHLCLLSVHLNFLSICKLFNILDLFSRTKGPILSKTSSMHPSVFKRVRIIGSCTFPRGNYSKRVKWLLQLQIEIFSRMTRPISTKLDTKHPIGEGNQVCFNLGPLSFLWGDDRHI